MGRSQGNLPFAGKALTEQVREALRRRGVSSYRLAQETGVSQRAAWRFLNEPEKECWGSTLDAFARYLGAELAAPAEPKARGRASRR